MSVSTWSKTFVKSRENLQELSKNGRLLEKYVAFDNVLNYIGHTLQAPFFKKRKEKKFIIDLCQINIPYNTMSELIEVLKQEYPGVDFTYTSATIQEGMHIAPVFCMDWS